jgi:transmembrane sensor
MSILFGTPRNRTSEEALVWLARLKRGLSPAEGIALLAWLKRRGHRSAIARAAAEWHDPEVLALLAQIFPISPAMVQPRRRSRQVVAVASACIIAMVPVAFLLAVGLHRHVYTTAPAATGRLILEDGTRVELNRATQIDVAYAGRARSVQVSRGEALFNVPSDSYRSFYIHAAGRHFETRAATFDVRFSAPHTLSLIVLTGTVTAFPPPSARPLAAGSVRVFGSKADEPIRLGPLQMLVIEDGGEAGQTLTEQEALSHVSWHRGL